MACFFVFISKVKNGTIIESNKAMIERMAKIPSNLKNILTCDRGSEYQELEEQLGLKCYFAHACHSRERGANEKTCWKTSY